MQVQIENHLAQPVYSASNHMRVATYRQGFFRPLYGRDSQPYDNIRAMPLLEISGKRRHSMNLVKSISILPFLLAKGHFKLIGSYHRFCILDSIIYGYPGACGINENIDRIEIN